MIDSKKLIEVASYFSIVHHIKGRIRLRVDPKIKELNNNITLEDIEDLPKKIKGIKSIKINKIIGSITVEYDNAIFADRLWNDLIEGNNIEELADMINNLAKEAV